jgi:hypothetical protein
MMGGSTEVSLPPTTAKNTISPVRPSLCITNRDISMRLKRRLHNRTLKATHQGGEYRKNLLTITTSTNDWALQGAYLIQYNKTPVPEEQFHILQATKSEVGRVKAAT